jgi:hypothetical protein
MTIRDNVKKVQRKILREMSEEQNDFTQEVQDKSVQAILRGFGDNEQCEAYMSLFAETPAQLDRLLARDGSTGADHKGKDRARAYLMANGPCGPDTVLNFENGVTSDLDEGL